MIIYHTMIYPGFDICQAAWRAFADRRKVRRWQAAAVTIQKVRWGWRWKYERERSPKSSISILYKTIVSTTIYR